MGQRATIFNM